MNVKDIKFPPIHRMLGRFLGRFHIITFTIIVIGGLSIVTFTLNQIIASSSEKTTGSMVNQEAPEFDTITIERVNNLRQSTGEIKPLYFPSGKRTNPFSE